MRLSDDQVRQTLLALRSAPPAPTPARPAADALTGEVAALAARLADGRPRVRQDRVAAAKALLEHGDVQAREVASALVGRLVCDRLR